VHGTDPAVRDRRAVRRQVLLATTVRVVRLPRHGASCRSRSPVSCSADRQARGKISTEGVSSWRSSRRTRRTTCRDDGRALVGRHSRGCCEDRPEPADERDPGRAERSTRVKTRLSLTGPLVVARDIRARQDQGAAGCRRADAGLPARARRSTTPGRPRTPEGYGVRLVRPDHGRPDGLLRRAVPGRRRLVRHAGQGERARRLSPRPAGRTGASTSARSAAPGRPRWPRTAFRRVEGAGVPPSSGMEAVWNDRGPRTSRLFVVVDDKGNDFFADVTKPMADDDSSAASRALGPGWQVWQVLVGPVWVGPAGWGLCRAQRSSQRSLGQTRNASASSAASPQPGAGR